MPEKNKPNFFNTLLFILYIIFLGSVVFSFRAITSITIACIPLAGLIKNKAEQQNFPNHTLANPLFIFCCLLFLAEIFSLIYTHNQFEGWKNIWGKSVLIVVPLGLYCCNYITSTTRKQILKWYCIMLFAACAFALYRAFADFLATNDTSVFFYHRLVSLYSGHAIQFSILVLVGLLYLFESLRNKERALNKIFQLFLVFFFSIFLFLLSSKLVISFYIIYIFYYLIKIVREKRRNKPAVMLLIAGFATSCILLFSTNNVISRRFIEIIGTDFGFLKKEKFTESNYFNGLQFRLLQWKLVPEILNDKKAWLGGVGVGDGQADLNEKYSSKKLYTGTPERGDTGFLGYNTHNEFLEALLQTGIVGFLLFALICFTLIKMVLQKKSAVLTFITMLLLAYSFSESVLESQYSSIIFLFFPVFFCLNGNKNLS